MFQLTTPVAPQNRAGVRSSKIQSGKLIKAALRDADTFLSTLSTNLRIPFVESNHQRPTSNPAARAVKTLRDLCLILEELETQKKISLPFLVAGQEQTLYQITDTTLNLMHPKASTEPALQIVAQLREEPFLLHTLAVLRTNLKLENAKTPSEKAKYALRLEALQQYPKKAAFKDSKVPRPLDKYRQLFELKFLRVLTN